MVSRPRCARPPSKTDSLGSPQLTLAHLIVTLENIVRIFAQPLLLAGFFIALAWLGLFASLYPWTHIAALVIFTAFFFRALGTARAKWKPASFAEAKRRVEDASHLLHRPLDTLEDRPMSLEPEQTMLWQAHKARALEATRHLRWPRWTLSFADKDPYALRFALTIALTIGLISGWGLLGGRLLGAINPAIAKLHLTNPTLDAWITPPEYTHLPPIMIATPAGLRHDSDVIDVPEGSVVTAHMVEKTGDAPTLIVNDEKTAFETGDDRDYGIEAAIHDGNKITIRRGWEKLASWHIRVVKDQPPQIAITDPPKVTERKSLALSYEAKDDYGVVAVNMRVTPRESLPGASSDPIELPLSTPDAKDVQRVDFEDLTSHPWAGLPVQIQLTATDAMGHVAQSEPVDITLPERTFTHPIAQALIEERKKILQTPDNDALRNEVANIMAGVAHQPSTYNGDPVVLMALRSGAVRLVLDPGRESIEPVGEILWESAVRIEDGAMGLAEKTLRQAQKDLADALDHNASERDIQRLIDRLHEALDQYLSELATRMASRPGPAQDLGQILGPQTNMLSPDDVDRMMEQMKNLSATGARDQARNQLSRLQQMLENLRTQPPQFTEQQKEALRQLLALRDLSKHQQDLLDKTFQNAQAHDPKSTAQLATEQKSLLHQLQDLMGAMKGAGTDKLQAGAQAMQNAGSSLDKGADRDAVTAQNEAVKDMQAFIESMTNEMRAGMMMLPMPGMAEKGHDPFGRNPGGMAGDDGSVKLPDQMQARHVREILDELQRRAGDMNRPQTERDYIQRLLQNF